MATLRVEGGRPLSGRIDVEGNKNAALPLIAACLLTRQPCELLNVPRIRDVDVLLDFVVGLGARVEGAGTSSLRMGCERIVTDEPDPTLVGKLRGSVLLLGPLLARSGSARLAPPGGDFPARRTISTHLEALRAMGAVVSDAPGHVLSAPDGLTGASMYLAEASVTGTETALLAAAAARGPQRDPTRGDRAACRRALRVPASAGRRHRGAAARRSGSSRRPGCGRATHALRRLHRGRQLGGDRGDHGRRDRGHRRALARPRGGRCAPAEMGLACRYDADRLSISRSTLARGEPDHDRPVAGVPSDMVSLVTVLATQAAGRTLVHDWLYELRLFALEQLSAMRADFFLCDPHRIIVTGPTKLRGRALDTAIFDLAWRSLPPRWRRTVRAA